MPVAALQNFAAFGIHGPDSCKGRRHRLLRAGVPEGKALKLNVSLQQTSEGFKRQPTPTGEGTGLSLIVTYVIVTL